MKGIRLLAVFLLTVLLLVGCNQNPPVNTQSSSNLNPHSNSDDATPADSTTQPSDSTTEPENLTTGNYTLYFDYYDGIHNEVQPFQNGLAVNRILYDNKIETKLYIAVINTKGEILYKLDTGLDQNLSDSLYTYSKGADFEIIGSGKDLVCFKYGDVYHLINSKGKELLNSSDGEIDRVLAVGDGNALVYKNVSSISSNEEKLGTIDSDGNWILPLTAQDVWMDGLTELRYLGFGIYLWKTVYRTAAYDFMLFNAFTNVWSDKFELNTFHCGDNYIGTFIEDEEENDYWAWALMSVQLYDSPDKGISYISYDKASNKFAFYDAGYLSLTIKGIVDDCLICTGFFEDDDGNTNEYYLCYIKDSWYYYKDFKTKNYYNDYDYGVTSIEYLGDVFIVHVVGMDKENYIVVLNKEMVAISEPIPGYSRYYDNGKLFNGDVLTDLQGNVINDSFPSEYYLSRFSDGISVGTTSSWNSETRYISETGEILFETLTDSKSDHTHNWSSTWSYNEEAHWHACSECNEKSDYSLHNWTEWETHEPSADDETSSRERHCTVCGWFTVELGEITVGG